MPVKPSRLNKLKLGEVSLVDAGANQHAHVLLWKRDDDGAARALAAEAIQTALAAQISKRIPLVIARRIAKGAGADAVADAEAQEKARKELYAFMDEFWKAQSTLSTAVENIIRDDAVADKKAAINEAIETVLSRIKEHGAGDGDVTKGAGSPPLPIPPAAGDGSRKVNKMAGDNTDLAARVAELEASLAAEKTRADTAVAEVETEKRNAVAKSDGVVADLQKRLETNEATLATAIEKAERLDFAKRAETEFPHLPGTAEEKGEQLRAVHKMADGPAKEGLLKALKASDGAFKSLTTEIGKAGKSVAGTATEELKKQASDIRKSDPKLSEGAAMQQAMKADPALAAKYDEETRRGE